MNKIETILDLKETPELQLVVAKELAADTKQIDIKELLSANTRDNRDDNKSSSPPVQ